MSLGKAIKLYAEGRKLCAESRKLYAKGSKLWAEGYELCAEGRKLWADELIRLFGFVPDCMKDIENFMGIDPP